MRARREAPPTHRVENKEPIAYDVSRDFNPLDTADHGERPTPTAPCLTLNCALRYCVNFPQSTAIAVGWEY